MDRLFEGYRRFRSAYYKEHAETFRELALRGQRPESMLIGCSDARVDPARTFDTSPGEMFIVRNVANLVPPYAPDSRTRATSAALEFAVKGLEVKNIIVLGHARCGGVAALMGAISTTNTDFIEPWMNIAAAARDRAKAEATRMGHAHDGPQACHICEQEGVKTSLTNLMTFPWIAERVHEGRLTIHGLYFDITTGELRQLRDGQFVRID